MGKRKERWVFTAEEVKRPQLCLGTDNMLATLEDAGCEVGVVVHRNGEVTNCYGDGIVGVTADHRDLAGDEDELTRIDVDNPDPADVWRDVEVHDDGTFSAFVGAE